MAVKCLNAAQKNFIGVAYRNKHKTQKELAKYLNTSERTVNRVLEELGLATPVARIKGEAYQVMQLLKKHNVDIPTLQKMLEFRSKVPSLQRDTAFTKVEVPHAVN